MRTTVRIDDDLLRQMKDRAHRENSSLSKLLNEMLRRGLSRGPQRRRPFKQKTHAMGETLIDLTKANAIAAELEDEAILRKMALGK